MTIALPNCEKITKVETYKLNRLEITANFLLGNEFSPDHYHSVVDMVRNRLDGFYSKGAIYLSPLTSDQLHRDLLLEFVKIKNMRRLPTYLYLIQRL